MNTYFISDLHFGHANILKFERTQFSTIQEHDNFIIEQINKVVKLNDVLYILGDIGEAENVRKLNGRKILIMGNHDNRPINEYYTYFTEVHDRPIYFTKRIVLSHEPIKVNDSVLNIHGHIHGAKLDSRNHLNVSIAVVDYKPVPEHTPANIVGRLPKENYHFLEEWYAREYLFTVTGRNDVVTDENGKIKIDESILLRNTRKKDALGYVLDVFEKVD